MKKNTKTLHDHLVIVHNLLFIGAILMLVAVLFQNTVLFWVVEIFGILVLIASARYAAKYFQCPHCGTKLDSRRKVPNFCPNCGKELN